MSRSDPSALFFGSFDSAASPPAAGSSGGVGAAATSEIRRTDSFDRAGRSGGRSAAAGAGAAAGGAGRADSSDDEAAGVSHAVSADAAGVRMALVASWPIAIARPVVRGAQPRRTYHSAFVQSISPTFPHIPREDSTSTMGVNFTPEIEEVGVSESATVGAAASREAAEVPARIPGDGSPGEEDGDKAIHTLRHIRNERQLSYVVAGKQYVLLGNRAEGDSLFAATLQALKTSRRAFMGDPVHLILDVADFRQKIALFMRHKRISRYDELVRDYIINSIREHDSFLGFPEAYRSELSSVALRFYAARASYRAEEGAPDPENIILEYLGVRGLDHYFDAMEKNGCLGGEVELKAIQECMDTQIAIVNIQTQLISSLSPSSTPEVYLAFNGIHYSLLLDARNRHKPLGAINLSSRAEMEEEAEYTAPEIINAAQDLTGDAVSEKPLKKARFDGHEYSVRGSLYPTCPYSTIWQILRTHEYTEKVVSVYGGPEQLRLAIAEVLRKNKAAYLDIVCAEIASMIRENQVEHFDLTLKTFLRKHQGFFNTSFKSWSESAKLRELRSAVETVGYEAYCSFIAGPLCKWISYVELSVIVQLTRVQITVYRSGASKIALLHDDCTHRINILYEKGEYYQLNEVRTESLKHDRHAFSPIGSGALGFGSAHKRGLDSKEMIFALPPTRMSLLRATKEAEVGGARMMQTARVAAENLHEVVSPSASKVATEGLIYQDIPGDGHCLFNAIAIHIGQDQATLRNVIADHITHNLHEYRTRIEAIHEGRTAEQYLEALRVGEEWADNLEIAILIKLLDRPIVVIGPDGKVRNGSDLKGSGKPIFVHYNGHNHYDAYLLEEAWSGRAQEILTRLLAMRDDHSAYSLHTSPVRGANGLVHELSRVSEVSAAGAGAGAAPITNVPAMMTVGKEAAVLGETPPTSTMMHLGQPKARVPMSFSAAHQRALKVLYSEALKVVKPGLRNLTVLRHIMPEKAQSTNPTEDAAVGKELFIKELVNNTLKFLIKARIELLEGYTRPQPAEGIILTYTEFCLRVDLAFQSIFNRHCAEYKNFLHKKGQRWFNGCLYDLKNRAQYSQAQEAIRAAETLFARDLGIYRKYTKFGPAYHVYTAFLGPHLNIDEMKKVVLAEEEQVDSERQKKQAELAVLRSSSLPASLDVHVKAQELQRQQDEVAFIQAVLEFLDERDKLLTLYRKGMARVVRSEEADSLTPGQREAACSLIEYLNGGKGYKMPLCKAVSLEELYAQQLLLLEVQELYFQAKFKESLASWWGVSFYFAGHKEDGPTYKRLFDRLYDKAFRSLDQTARNFFHEVQKWNLAELAKTPDMTNSLIQEEIKRCQILLTEVEQEDARLTAYRQFVTRPASLLDQREGQLYRFRLLMGLRSGSELDQDLDEMKAALVAHYRDYALSLAEAESLLRYGLHPDYVDESRRTLLHHALDYPFSSYDEKLEEVVRHLLNTGIDILAEDNEGLTIGAFISFHTPRAESASEWDSVCTRVRNSILHHFERSYKVLDIELNLAYLMKHYGAQVELIFNDYLVKAEERKAHPLSPLFYSSTMQTKREETITYLRRIVRNLIDSPYNLYDVFDRVIGHLNTSWWGAFGQSTLLKAVRRITQEYKQSPGYEAAHFALIPKAQEYRELIDRQSANRGLRAKDRKIEELEARLEASEKRHTEERAADQRRHAEERAADKATADARYAASEARHAASEARHAAERAADKAQQATLEALIRGLMERSPAPGPALTAVPAAVASPALFVPAPAPAPVNTPEAAAPSPVPAPAPGLSGR